eukprot:403367808
MKNIRLTILPIIILVAFLQKPTLQASTCTLKLALEDQQNYQDLAYGFTSGLYKSNQPNTTCALCTNLSSLSGNIQIMFIRLEAVRLTWTNQQYLNSLGFFDKVSVYTSMFDSFVNLGTHLDTLFRSTETKSMVTKVVNRFDSSFGRTMRMNVFDNIVSIFLFARTSPGASCKSLGVRAGAALRKVLQVSFD